MATSMPPAPSASTPSGDSTPAAPGAQPALEFNGTPPWAHYLCIAVSVLGPVGLALPPRRMGMRSLVLVGGTSIATSQVVYDYTGVSLFGRFGQRAQSAVEASTSGLPDAALQRQAAMRAEKERRAALAQAQAAGQAPADPRAGDSAAEAAEKTRLQKLWMGNEGKDWVQQRAQHERETLDSGGSYWDLIMEQIGEAVEQLLPNSVKPDASQPDDKKDGKK